VQAQQQLDVHTNIPALAAAIRYGEDWVGCNCMRVSGPQLAAYLQVCWCADRWQMICTRLLAQVFKETVNERCRFAGNYWSAGHLQESAMLQSFKHCPAC
jgi:hypothetical protein